MIANGGSGFMYKRLFATSKSSPEIHRERLRKIMKTYIQGNELAVRNSQRVPSEIKHK
jgi:IMP dehydrogenase/GMP reductase